MGALNLKWRNVFISFNIQKKKMTTQATKKNHNNIKGLDPAVWGPPFWFVLHTMALTYPRNPNVTVKKKYYDFLQNLPLFLPVADIGNAFSALLDKYPVTPYLDSQPSFVKWMHFIHNKINVGLLKPEVTQEEALLAYYEHYKPKPVKTVQERRRREKLIFGFMVAVVFVVSVILYRR